MCAKVGSAGDPPPADPKELTFLALDTRTPYTTDFDGADAGFGGPLHAALGQPLTQRRAVPVNRRPIGPRSGHRCVKGQLARRDRGVERGAQRDHWGVDESETR